jgi:hypothetical protein
MTVEDKIIVERGQNVRVNVTEADGLIIAWRKARINNKQQITYS